MMAKVFKFPTHYDPWVDKKQLALHWNTSIRTIERLIARKRNPLPMELRFGKKQINMSRADEWAADKNVEKGVA